MIVDNIKIVTLIVILLFLIPIIWNGNKIGFRNISSLSKFIKLLNKSLIIQGIILLTLIPVTWFWKELAGTTYTYLVIGIFMYLPSLVLLNIVRIMIEKYNFRKES
jgi:hypothetical protein